MPMSKIDLSKAKPGDRFCCRNGIVMSFVGPNTTPNKDLYPYVLQRVSGSYTGYTFKVDGTYTSSGLESIYDLVAVVNYPPISSKEH